jgi:hypothetical protein
VMAALREADGGTRTPDPFITSEVLYQLSYVGAKRLNDSRLLLVVPAAAGPRRAFAVGLASAATTSVS